MLPRVVREARASKTWLQLCRILIPSIDVKSLSEGICIARIENGILAYFFKKRKLKRIFSSFLLRTVDKTVHLVLSPCAKVKPPYE
jgi:hypothetical protein